MARPHVWFVPFLLVVDAVARPSIHVSAPQRAKRKLHTGTAARRSAVTASSAARSAAMCSSP